MPKLSKEEELRRVTQLRQREDELIKSGYKFVCGIDEAGRGPLAGPVFAAAVILPEGEIIEGINDSKKLSPKKRDELYDIICKKAIAWSSASVSEKVIDEINILNATYLAMKEAAEKLSDISSETAEELMRQGYKIRDIENAVSNNSLVETADGSVIIESEANFK